MPKKSCVLCGKTFDPSETGQIKFCSYECRREAKVLRDRSYRKNQKCRRIICSKCGKQFRTYSTKREICEDCKKQAQNRGFTADTPFLCQKWYAEGMSARQIADILGRSVPNVQKALREPLSTEHRQIVTQCTPKNRRAAV